MWTSDVAERSIRLDGKHGDAATAVIRDEYELPEGINAEMSRTCALRADHIQLSEIPGGLVDG